MAESKVQVNMVSPGIMENFETDFNFPMSRSAKFSEVVRVIEFLLDKKSEYITGQNIEVAGGVRLK